MSKMPNKPHYYPVVSDNLPKHIKKGHQMVFSRQDLSAREADMFALMIANMSEDDWERTTPHYEFTAHQLSEWLNVDSKHIGSNLSPVANRLASRKIGIKIESEKNDTEFDYRPLFKHIAYKNGILTMVPNDMLKSEYIAYNQGFALINTQNFLNVKKEYSKRLYELLSRFKTGGTGMHIQKINELKGIFGLLDESGKLKKDKSSFKNNSVFMKRCIRDSIEELSTNTNTRKELLFLDSNKGEKGYELVKQGRSIVGIKFLYRWIKSDKFEELNLQDAQSIIRELELKRLQHGQKLTVEELEKLASAYRVIGRDGTAQQIEASIVKRNSTVKENSQENHNELESMLEKIDTLKEMGDNPEY